MEDTVVPIIAIFVVVGAPIAAWVITRVLAHQERMEMLKRGFVPPPDPHAMRHAAKWGMKSGWVPGPGPGASVPPPGWSPAAYDPSYQAQAHLRKGVQVAFIGLALLIGLSFIGHHAFGPWLLGGLIPLFVGIAQIITAIMGGAQFGQLPGVGCSQAESQYSASAPQAPSAPSGPPPPPSSYGGWRPTGMTEIEPASPPDRR
ncbi:MAG: hypothetical protein ABI431_08195 [Candidatus Tumulicola sp.]